MSKLNNIIIHCSDSEFGSASEIRRWHLSNGWFDIGYHFVILNGNILSETKNRTGLYIPCMNGSIEIGRYLDGDNLISGNEIGAHALGYNNKSIGICLIGRKEFTIKQFVSLTYLLENLMSIYNIPLTSILGHYEVSQNRTCPNFDVSELRDNIKNKQCKITTKGN
jgi:N-acetylmuramoyl-L-alanine amidase